MIINFVGLPYEFNRLPVGTVLSDTKGNRYMKNSMCCWVPSKLTIKGCYTDKEVLEKAEADWTVWL